MKCLVINVASAAARMEFMTQQLTICGLSFERIEALTPRDVLKFSEAYDWDSWERPLKDTEKACFLSHVAAWRMVASQNVPMLILEDDALLSDKLPAVMAALERFGDFDHVTLEVRKRKKIVARTGQELLQGYQLLRLYQDRSGAAAYVVSPAGARKLLARTRSQVALADALICKSYELRSFQIEPACAVQLDRAPDYNISTTFITSSQIDDGHEPDGNRWVFSHRTRRILAQLRMGFRALCCIGWAERRSISLDPNDFMNRTV